MIFHSKHATYTACLLLTFIQDRFFLTKPVVHIPTEGASQGIHFRLLLVQVCAGPHPAIAELGKMVFFVIPKHSDSNIVGK